MTARHLLFLPALAFTLACLGGPEPTPGPAEVASPMPAGDFPSAPPLGVNAWVRGEPVDIATAPGVVLVEHWATWCGPCKVEFPHLTALQAEHADALTVVGISDEPSSLVRPFVDRNDELMRYTVATASADAIRAWTDLSGADGIPYSYLVTGGQIVWHGHPASLEPVLPHVLAGTWTQDAAQLHASLPRIPPAYLSALETKGVHGAAAVAQTLLDNSSIGADTKNELSWTILTEVPADLRDLPLALSLAQQATDEVHHTSWAYEDTLGLALSMNGSPEEAVRAQELAVSLCEAAQAGPPCVELSDRLTAFRAAL